MNGTFNVSLLDSRSYKDEDFLQAIDKGTINRLLESLPVEQKLENQNAVHHWTVPYLFQMLMSGPSGPGVPFTTDNSQFICCCLMSASSEPSFSEAYTMYMGGYDFYVWYNTDCINVSGAGKLLINNSIESYLLAKDTQGRESVFFRDRWLFLPSEGVSSVIRGLGIFGSDRANSVGPVNYVTWGRSCRVRFKDSGGNPVTINKLNTQAMVVDYTVTLVSI